jgi:spermidine synthase
MARERSFIIPIVVLGFSGMVAQILLLRELFVTFFGNELSIAVVLANWLALEAAGSLAGRGLGSSRRKVAIYVVLQIAFSIGLPVCILLTRILKNIMGTVPGEGLGLVRIALSSFLILIPPASTHGALFTVGCGLLSEMTGRSALSIGRVYLYEIIGTTSGGIILTALLLPRVQSFHIVFSLTVLNMIACLFLLRTWTQRTFRKGNPGVLASVALLCLVGSLSLVVTPWGEGIHRKSLSWQWRGRQILLYRNSPYGNIALTREGEQLTLFSDGVPLYSLPFPDIEQVEDLAHFPLLAHPEPGKVLVVSGGAGGLLAEALKHPVQRIDYVELDPLILDTVSRFAPADTLRILYDPRVRVWPTDGRRFLRTTDTTYDVILIGLSDPRDLQTNRLFTEEFYELARSRLEQGGILALQASGSMSYLSDEMRRTNASVLETLGAVFQELAVIPGERNLYLAFNGGSVALADGTLDRGILGRHLEVRGLDLQLVTPFYIDYRLDPVRLAWFRERMIGVRVRRNRDFAPAGVLYNLSLWHATFSSRGRSLLDFMDTVRTEILLTGLAALPLVSFILSLTLKRRMLGTAVVCTVLTTGFAGMMFDLILIFTFQILYGYVYLVVGVLITAFMAGSGLGSYIATTRLRRIERVKRLFLFLDIGILIFTALLALTPLVQQNVQRGAWIDGGAGACFTAICFAGGFLIGFQFPLAGRIHHSISGGAAGTAGLLNGVDLLGGFAGGLIGGIFLLPVIGLTGTCAAVMLIKTASLILFIRSSIGRIS